MVCVLSSLQAGHKSLQARTARSTLSRKFSIIAHGLTRRWPLVVCLGAVCSAVPGILELSRRWQNGRNPLAQPICLRVRWVGIYPLTRCDLGPRWRHQPPTLRHRPRRAQSVWLAQETEDRCRSRSRAIQLATSYRSSGPDTRYR
jgi:hypothetical protein